jgi:hypothetical protein
MKKSVGVCPVCNCSARLVPLLPEERQRLSVPPMCVAICSACIGERSQVLDDAEQLDEADFGTEGDLRRVRMLEQALGRFFGARNPTFARAFQGHSVAHAVISIEMFAFHASVLCVAIEKGVLPLLQQLPDQQQLAAFVRDQLANVIECGNGRPTHPEAKQLLRSAMIAAREDMAKEASSPSVEDCISHREPSESNGAAPSGSHGTGNAPDVDRRSAPEELGRGFGGSL